MTIKVLFRSMFVALGLLLQVQTLFAQRDLYLANPVLGPSTFSTGATIVKEANGSQPLSKQGLWVYTRTGLSSANLNVEVNFNNISYAPGQGFGTGFGLRYFFSPSLSVMGELVYLEKRSIFRRASLDRNGGDSTQTNTLANKYLSTGLFLRYDFSIDAENATGVYLFGGVEYNTLLFAERSISINHPTYQNPGVQFVFDAKNEIRSNETVGIIGVGAQWMINPYCILFADFRTGVFASNINNGYLRVIGSGSTPSMSQNYWNIGAGVAIRPF